MDPITIGLAFSAAEAAVAGIKRAIALGKDVQSIGSDLSLFFKNRTEVQKASLEISKKSEDPDCPDDLMMHALDIAMKEKQLIQYENDLRNMFIYELDQSDVWYRAEKIKTSMLVKQQEAIDAANKRKIEEGRQKAAEEARKKRWWDNFWYNVQYALGVIIGIIMFSAAAYFGWDFLSNYHN